MRAAFATARYTALDDLRVLHDATWNEMDRARIAALIETLRLRQLATGETLDSSYTPAFRRVLKRERQQQRSASA